MKSALTVRGVVAGLALSALVAWSPIAGAYGPEDPDSDPQGQEQADEQNPGEEVAQRVADEAQDAGKKIADEARKDVDRRGKTPDQVAQEQIREHGRPGQGTGTFACVDGIKTWVPPEGLMGPHSVTPYYPPYYVC